MCFVQSCCAVCRAVTEQLQLSVLGREAEPGAALSIPSLQHQPQVPSWNPCWSVEQLSLFWLRAQEGPRSQGSLAEEAAGWLGISFQYGSGSGHSKLK